MAFEVDGRKLAYVAVENKEVTGGWMLAVVIENEPGYREILDYGSGTQQMMEMLAKKMNKDRGVTEEEAFRIVGTTMFKSRGRR